MAIKTSIPTCFFPTWQKFAFWRNKDKFFDSSSYFIAIMYTFVAQKVTQCFRNSRKQTNVQKTLFIILFAYISKVYTQFMKIVKLSISMAYKGRQIYSNSLYYTKAQNKYRRTKTEGRGQKNSEFT